MTVEAIAEEVTISVSRSLGATSGPWPTCAPSARGAIRR